MKIPICISCKTPLKIREGYARFRCMCDEDVRIIPIKCIGEHAHIKHLDINEASDFFIERFLTTSQNLVK